MKILSLDVGTTESGYCLAEDYTPIKFGKTDNNELLDIVKSHHYETLVYEQFKSYGMPIGDTTIKSIEWNGRFIQCAMDRGIPVYPITRQQEKINICHSSKAKDSTIRQALIDRFAQFDFKNGKGTKKNPDFFYGFSKDMWTAYCLTATYLDLEREKYEKGKI